MPRKIGGQRSGSAGLVYFITPIGRQFLEGSASTRARRAWPIGSMFVRHTLDIAELYVRLRESERRGELTVVAFDAEPASWHRGPVGVLKPDAYAVIEDGDWEDHLWWEIDRGTESLPTLRLKLLAFVRSVEAGDTGPLGVTPRVVVTVPDQRRLTNVEALIATLPPPADRLISTQLFDTTYAGPARPPP